MLPATAARLPPAHHPTHLSLPHRHPPRRLLAPTLWPHPPLSTSHLTQHLQVDLLTTLSTTVCSGRSLQFEPSTVFPFNVLLTCIDDGGAPNDLFWRERSPDAMSLAAALTIYLRIKIPVKTNDLKV